MDLVFLSKWLGAVSLVLSVITAAWALLNRSTKPYDDKLAVHDEDLKKHDRRIQSLEDKLPFLPSKDEVHEIKLSMAEIRGEMAAISRSANATEQAVRRIDDYLREEGK